MNFPITERTATKLRRNAGSRPIRRPRPPRLDPIAYAAALEVLG